MANRAQIFQALLTSQRAGGVTLATGKAYFYEAGNQPTLKTIYLDRAKTTPAANPYTLSADGTAAIYGDGLYDVKITNAAGVEKFFWEDVKIQELAGEVFANITDYSNDLATAVSAIGATKTTLIIGTDQTIAANLTVPATLELFMINGATITINSGKTLTVNSPFTGVYQVFTVSGTLALNGVFTTGVSRVFAGGGTVTFGTGSVAEVHPEWWAVNTTPGTTDMTSAISAALATGLNVRGDSNYAITSVTASTAGKSHYFNQITLLADGTDIGITLSAANISLHVAKFNGNSQGRSGVSIAADRCRVQVDEIYNINAADTSTAFVSGVEVNSGTASHVEIKAHDFVRDIVASGSTPRVLTIQDTSSDTTGNVYGEDIHGLVTCSTDAHLGILHGESCADNGVYHLGGNLVIDFLAYYGSEENIVTEVGNITVGSIVSKGTSAAVIGLQDAGNVSIGKINLIDVSGASPYQVVNTRAGNTASGRVTIDSIVGTMTGKYLSYMTTGTVEYLSIGSMDITYRYDAGVSEAINQFWNISACKGYNIGPSVIRIIDVNDAFTSGTPTSNLFVITGPTANLTHNSFWNNVRFHALQGDGTTEHPYASGRGANFASDKVFHNNSTFQDVAGTIYVMGSARSTSDASGGNSTVSAAAPTGGTWRIGTDLAYSLAIAAPFRTRCTVSGTPGTWVDY